MIIGRKYEGYRPYYIDNKQVDNIVFYDDSGIITETDYGWLEGSESVKLYFQSDIKEIDIDSPVKRLKVNLTRKENFYIPVKEHIGDSVYCLYLYVDGDKIKIDNLGESVFLDSDFSTTYTDKLFIKINDISFYSWKKPTNRTVDKPEYIKTKEIAEELKKEGVDIPEFSLFQLLKKYEVKKKC